MAKRVYQVAKSLGVKGVELVHYLRDQGFEIKSHMSPMTDDMVEAVEKKYAAKVKEKTAAKKTAKKATAKKAAKKTAKKAAKKTAKKAVKKAPKKVAEKDEIAASPVEDQVEAPVSAPEESEVAAQSPEPEAPEVEATVEPPEPVKESIQEESGVKVSRKADQKEKPKPEPEPEKAKVEEEKPKPRVIRYAPGMEPGARPQPTRVQPQTESRPRPERPYSGPGRPQGRGGYGGGAHGGGTHGGPGAGPGAGGGAAQGGAWGDKRGKKRRKKRDDQEIKRSVRQTMASLDNRATGKKRRRSGGSAQPVIEHEKTEVQEQLLRILPLSTLAELANAMKVPENEVIGTCLRSGLMVTINQRLEKEDIELIATEYDFEVEFLTDYEAEAPEEIEAIEEFELEARGPIVTVMGHVDHGKTKLLDYIRNANVAEGEAGAITQHIGAYSVEAGGGMVTFLDTPGHEAFTAMRARGTQVTDIVILIVAADDGVMPQTVEAIDHAKAAKVPIIVAVNKIDLPAANPDRVKQELLQHGITVEDFGGDTVCLPISAKFGQGVDQLLEAVHLQAEMLELKGAPRLGVKGTVIEAKKDPGRGVIFTVLVQQGTLKVGMSFSVGLHFGTVRALVNEWGQRIETAGPGIPVEVLGSSDVPEAGDSFTGVESEVKAREISIKRQQLRREQEIRYQRRMTLDDLYSQINQGEVRELKLVLKGDVSGSVEAMADNFQKLSTDEVKVAVIHKSVGTINEGDVLLAAASEAIIIGFHVRPQVSVRDMAKRENVEIRTYEIIYEAVDDIKQAMGGLLSPEIKERVLGTAEVRQVFRVPRIGVIAGCYVQDGIIERKAQIRVLREGVVLSTRKLSSLKRFKEDVGKVESGFECGIGLVDFQDLKEGDVLEAFVSEEHARSI